MSINEPWVWLSIIFGFHFVVLYLGWFRWSTGDIDDAPIRLFLLTLFTTMLFFGYAVCVYFIGIQNGF